MSLLKCVRSVEIPNNPTGGLDQEDLVRFLGLYLVMISDPKFENGERSCYMNDRGCNIPRNEEWRGGLKKRGGNLKPGRGERVIGRIEGRI